MQFVVDAEVIGRQQNLECTRADGEHMKFHAHGIAPLFEVGTTSTGGFRRVDFQEAAPAARRVHGLPQGLRIGSEDAVFEFDARCGVTVRDEADFDFAIDRLVGNKFAVDAP